MPIMVPSLALGRRGGIDDSPPTNPPRCFTFESGNILLFSMAAYLRGNGHPMYDASPDDQRFVMLQVDEAEAAESDVILVTNWFTELRERMGNHRAIVLLPLREAWPQLENNMSPDFASYLERELGLAP
jgi:hypothetical protein